MTSRTQLEELLQECEAAEKDVADPKWFAARTLRKAAAFIRSLLAQEPVAMVEDGVLVWLEGRDADDGTLIYAAPVPAVDLEAFKSETMRKADVIELEATSVAYAECSPMGDPSLKYKRQALEEARAALAAHLDKLGGK